MCKYCQKPIPGPQNVCIDCSCCYKPSEYDALIAALNAHLKAIESEA